MKTGTYIKRYIRICKEKKKSGKRGSNSGQQSESIHDDRFAFFGKPKYHHTSTEEKPTVCLNAHTHISVWMLDTLFVWHSGEEHIS